MAIVKNDAFDFELKCLDTLDRCIEYRVFNIEFKHPVYILVVPFSIDDIGINEYGDRYLNWHIRSTLTRNWLIQFNILGYAELLDRITDDIEGCYL